MNTGVLKEKKRDGGYLEHKLDKPVSTLGRSKDNDIVVPDSSVSRLHVRFENRNGRYYIFDNNSSNGTYVNKKKVSESVLADGDDIIAGRVQFYFAQREVAADPLMGETAETPRMQLAETVETRAVKPGMPQPNQPAPPVSAYEDTPQAPQPTMPSPPPPPQSAPQPPAPPQAPPAPSYQAPQAPPPPAPMPPAPPYGGAAQAPPAPQVPQAPPMPQAPPYGGPMDAAPASPVYRLLAQIIDGVLIGVAYTVLIVLGILLKNGLIALLFNLVGLAGVLGYLFIGWSKFGKTLGKHVLGLQIVEVDNPQKTGLEIKTILMRILGMFLCSLPLYLGYLTILFDPEGRGFHDKLAGTQVVKKS